MTKINVITPVYNCEKKIETTIYSIVGQTYKNWHLFIIDDMCTDNTIDVIEKLKKSLKLEKKITVVSRKEKFGETRNTHDIATKLDPESIVVRVDAGDFITDLGCFDQLHQIYDIHDPAVLWTKHRWGFTEKNISGYIDPNISVYQQPWRSSHMKSFRVRDFLGLNEDNFKDEDGEWIMIACDQAVFLPIMERARISGRPMIFWDKVMYHYDIDLEDPDLFTRDRSINQKKSGEMIRERGYLV